MANTPEQLPPLNILLNQLDWNLQWLQQMEKNEPTPYYRDAALQRFDFTIRTAIKCIRAGALKLDRTCESPEECFILAEHMKWLPERTEWKAMLQDHESMKSEAATKDANTIFANLTHYSEQLKILFDRLSSVEQTSQ